MPTRSLGIAGRMAIIIVGLYFLVACLFTLGEALGVSASVRRATDAQISSLAAIDVPPLRQALWNFDFSMSDLIMNGMIIDPTIARIELKDEKGNTIRSVDRVMQGSGDKENKTGPPREYPLSYAPPGKAERYIGRLDIYPSLLEERKRIRETITLGMTRTLAIVVFLSAILAFVLERSLGAQLRDLARQISSFDAGERGRRAAIALPKARGELKLVARALARMASRIDTTVSALLASESRLESFFSDSPIPILEEDFTAVKKRIDEAKSRGVIDWEAHFREPERINEYISLIVVSDVNCAALKLFGYATKVDMIEHMLDLVGEGSIEAFRAEFTALASGQVFFEGDTVRYNSVGDEIFLQYRLNIVPGYEGTWSRVLASIVDISARTRAERALAESEVKYRSIVEQASEGMLLLDGRGTIVDSNPAIERITGFSETAMRERKVWDPCLGLWAEDMEGEESFRGLISDWSVALEEGKQWMISGPYDAFVRGAEGTTRVIEQTFFPVSMAKGLMAGGVFRDVTERRAASDALVTSLREKELLLQEVHHRVKNNLQVICSLIHLQMDEVGASTQTGQSLVDMEARVMSMSLVHELLYQSDDFTLVDFSSYASQLCATLLDAYAVDRKSIRMEVSAVGVALALDKAIPCGLILNELVVNSLKHAFPGGRAGEIHVLLSKSEEGLATLVVRDDGIGAEAGAHPQGARRTIGMSLVENLAKQLCGKYYYGTINGKGTETRVVFPAG
jgi:PAS domain S-box-containing protein